MEKWRHKLYFLFFAPVLNSQRSTKREAQVIFSFYFPVILAQNSNRS